MAFDELINRYQTKSLKYDSMQARNKPEDCLPFWVADMDFKAPQVVLDKLNERIQHGIFGYSEADADYNQAVLNWFKKQHQLDIKPEWIFQTPGVVYALALAVRALTEVGDAVLIMSPVYYPFFEVIVDNQRLVIDSQLKENDGYYSLDYADIEAKIQKHQVKLLIFCNPHNPIGRAWSKVELQKLVEIVKKYDCVLLSDEIHMDFVFEPHKHQSVIALDAIWNRWIICTSASKTFNLASLQLSNIIVQDEQLRQQLLDEKTRTGYSQPNVLGLVATQAAYEQGLPWLQEVRTYIKENYEYLKIYLRKHLPLIRVSPLEATYLVWLDFRAFNLDATDLNFKILEEAKLWLDDGLMFGASGSGFQRINIATSRKLLQKGLEQLVTAFKEEHI